MRCDPDNSQTRRTILLMGYWPPTDIGIEQRPGMLWDCKDRSTVTTPNGTKYDLVAISPHFDAPLGYDSASGIVPFWGTGASSATNFKVDYRETADRFWSVVAAVRPIAIMSFSRWRFDLTWNLDHWATNWGSADWTVQLEHVEPISQSRQTVTWDRPYVGGAMEDPSPFQASIPMPGSPPDPTLAAGMRRYSNLPELAMIDAVNTAVPGIVAQLNDHDGPGKFVSNFLAYHVAWYRDAYSGINNCRLSGHTHVGGAITAADAASAVRAQLNELYKALDDLC